MKRVLVTGAGGQLGKCLQDLAPEYESSEFFFLDKTALDITQEDLVLKAFEIFRPDYCVNCAAYTQVDQAERTPEPAFAINVQGVENIVAACFQYGTVLIHISTDYVFDGLKKEGYYPTDNPNPLNVYGQTKLEGEKIIQARLNAYFIVRTSWLYSKRHGPNFYTKILDQVKMGHDLRVTDVQKGRPTEASNLARHLLELINNGDRDFGIFHFTDKKTMSWFEFAQAILASNQMTGAVKLVKDNKSRSFARRPRNSILL